MKEKPTTDEKVLAALAHASVLFSFLGPIGPTIIWAVQRKKSKYASFHALQAMGYQAFSYWLWYIWIFLAAFVMIMLIVLPPALSANTTSDYPVFPFTLLPRIFISIFGLWGLFFFIGILGAIFCMTDHEFHYPIIGSWLKKRIFYETSAHVNASEEWEDNWVSGVCHSTAILQFWGIITPLAVWLTQKGGSAKIRYQALQAVFYQLMGAIVNILAPIAAVIIYALSVIGMLAFDIADNITANDGGLPPAAGLIPVVLMLVLILIWAISTVAVPLYYLFAATASLRLILGHDFNYPILGGVIARRIKYTNLLRGNLP